MFKQHTHWSNKFTYIMASAGAAIGLGNIWRFPYLAGINGGGAFVLMYIGFVILLGAPLMASEVLIGRRGLANAEDSFREIAVFRGNSPWWKIAGLWQICAGFLILSYYSVIAGWVLHYIYFSAIGRFDNITPDATKAVFNNMLASPTMMLFWASLVLIACLIIVAKGVNRGLEKAIYVMVPALAILVVILIGYAIEAGSFKQGLVFLFRPNFDQVTIHSVLLALGQAFFSLGIGMGIMLTYGTYVNKTTSIINSSVMISAADTMVALVAGMTIFPVVFAYNLSPSAGPSLIFKSLPLAFGHMPYGRIFATLFFLMLFFAAITSAIALLEPSVMYLMEKRAMPRRHATAIVGFTLWILSIGTVVSFNVGSHPHFFGMNFFEFLDYVTSNIMLPIGGLLTAIFTGWVMYRQDSCDELQLHHKHLAYRAWRFSVRFIAPIGILIIFVKSLGFI